MIAGHRSVRDRVGKMQAAKRGIDAESYDGSYRITQIDYQIDSLSNEMDSAHDSVQSYLESLNDFMSDRASQASWLIAECNADNLLDCSRLSAASQLFDTRNQEFRGASSREKAAFERKGGNKI